MDGLWHKTNLALLRLIDRTIPPALLHTRSSRGLARVFVVTHLLGALAASGLLLYLLQFTAISNLDLVFLALLAAVFFSLPGVLRWSGRIAVVALVSFQLLTVTSLVGTFENGGFASPFLPWLLVGLMSGLFYLPRQVGLVLGLFLLDVAVFFAFLLLSTRPDVPPGVDLTLLGWISIATAMGYMACMALYYSRLMANRAELQIESERYRAMSAELEHARAAAETLSLQRSQFFAKMSHELRTPLNAIIGYSEILVEDFEDLPQGNEQQLADLRRINATGRHLLSLVADVLDDDRIESGDSTLELATMALGDLLDDVVAASRPLLVANGNTLVLDCPVRADEIVTDPRKLRQMLINLMSNAAKFTHNGTVTLELWLEHDVSDVRLHAAVLDTGIGISTEAQSRLFETYVQADQTIQQRFGGTGIGLALTRKFASLLGGTIAVDSQPGHGSCFRIDLPALTRPAETDQPQHLLKLAS